MKSTDMGLQIFEDQLALLACIPDMTLRTEHDVEGALFRLRELSPHPEPNAA
jgi:hypothetical protein